MLKQSVKYSEDEVLLLEFNKRKKEAFSSVYLYFLDELMHFSQRLFHGSTISSEDLIHDIFISIWSNSTIKFISLEHIKNYLYNAIKNKHKDYFKHKLCVDKFECDVRNIEEYQFSIMVETEVISILNIADIVLTEECAKVLRMYVEGYDTKEIATILDKSQYTVYHQRAEAVTQLKRYISKQKIIFLLNILHIT